MFGYVTIHKKELKFKEYDVYRGYYCGLCHALKNEYGRTGQMLLNYDMTFLALLLSSLYEPEEQTELRRCVPHPVVPHEMRRNEMIGYAADMTLLLACEKALDDWRDDHSPAKRVWSGVLSGGAKKAAGRWPRQAASLRRNVLALAKAEREHDADIDRVSGYTGNFLGEMFVRREDIWQDPLRRMGFFLGKFIYLMDAWEDREKDRKMGRYNLLLELEQKGHFVSRDEMTEMLADTMARCCGFFERLPVVTNVTILRNILYAGVWTKYSSKEARIFARQKEENEKSI